ncbi:hypothetical protein LH61_05420 [Leuconostoc mesenteroides P45]|uniref:hypothetical protein n=1 Tax=Leuconostoc mesenteroides TaxID=1245 RepID=UPI0005054A14|nr:hypothetical protein [Leuconostoc mesenteroides]KGB50929.1 hypothetical protein LH61_05420 [Leuconostoc mesenteroides P45]
MAKQNLSDLNGYLFEQLDRLNDDNLKGEELNAEIERARSVAGVAKTVIDNARLVLSVQKSYDVEIGTEKPKLLTSDD